MVTAEIDAFVQEGSVSMWWFHRRRCRQSSRWGVLQTCLLGADNNVYAVAQGSLILGGFFVGDGGGTSIQKNHPTVAQLPNGAIMERTINTQILENGALTLLLENLDALPVAMMEEAINRYFPAGQSTLRSEFASRNSGQLQTVGNRFYRFDRGDSGRYRFDGSDCYG